MKLRPKVIWLVLRVIQTWQIAGVEDLVHVQCRKRKLFVRNDDHRVASADGRSKKRYEAEKRSRFIVVVVVFVVDVVGTDDADDADRFVQTDHGAVELSLLNGASILRMKNK